MARTQNRTDMVLNIHLKPPEQNPAELVLEKAPSHRPFRCETPVIDTEPVASGTVAVDEVLSCTTGVWTAVSSLQYTYQWYADDVLVVGRTESTCTLEEGDELLAHKCVVTAIAACGSDTSESNELTA